LIKLKSTAAANWQSPPCGDPAVIPTGIHSMLKQARDHKPNQWWLALLLAPFIGVLWVPSFDQAEPKLWDIPSFFWYHFLWVAISAIVNALIYFTAAPRRQPIQQNYLVNLAVALAVTLLLNIVHAAHGGDDAIEADYQEASS
jgi:hypothetical protein